MHLISRRNLLNDSSTYTEVKTKVQTWYQTVETSSWGSLEDVREVYPSADGVGNFTVFNIKSYRLIVGIDYESQVVYYKYFLTHSDYERGDWKNDPYF